MAGMVTGNVAKQRALKVMKLLVNNNVDFTFEAQRGIEIEYIDDYTLDQISKICYVEYVGDGYDTKYFVDIYTTLNGLTGYDNYLEER